MWPQMTGSSACHGKGVMQSGHLPSAPEKQLPLMLGPVCNFDERKVWRVLL